MASFAGSKGGIKTHKEEVVDVLVRCKKCKKLNSVMGCSIETACSFCSTLLVFDKKITVAKKVKVKGGK